MWCQSRTAVPFPFSLPLLYDIMGNVYYSEPFALSNSKTYVVYLFVPEGPFVYKRTNQGGTYYLPALIVILGDA